MSIFTSRAASVGRAAGASSAAVARACRRSNSSLLRSCSSRSLCSQQGHPVPSNSPLQTQNRISAGGASAISAENFNYPSDVVAFPSLSTQGGLANLCVHPSPSSPASRPSAAATPPAAAPLIVQRRSLHISATASQRFLKSHPSGSTSAPVRLYLADLRSASFPCCRSLPREQQLLLSPGSQRTTITSLIKRHNGTRGKFPETIGERNAATRKARAPLHRGTEGRDENTGRRKYFTIGAVAVSSELTKLVEPHTKEAASISFFHSTAAPSTQAASSVHPSSGGEETAPSPRCSSKSHVSPSCTSAEGETLVPSASTSCISSQQEEGSRHPPAATSSTDSPHITAGALETIPLRDPLVNASFSSKKIPKNYVKQTLIPHLESQITVMAKGLDEQQLTNLATAYAKLPPELRHHELEKELANKILFRVDGYNAQQIVQVLWPLYTLLQSHPPKQQLPIWRAFAERIEKDFILRDFSVLNLISILRVYQKVQDFISSADKQFSPRRNKKHNTTLNNMSSTTSNDHSSYNNNSSSSSSSSDIISNSNNNNMSYYNRNNNSSSISSSSRDMYNNINSMIGSGTIDEGREKEKMKVAVDVMGGVDMNSSAEIIAKEREERYTDTSTLLLSSACEEGEFTDLLSMLEGLLRKGLSAYDAIELHDIIISLSQHHRETRRDIQLMHLLLPLMEQRIQELSLYHLLSLLRALVKMKILHADLFDKAAAELQDMRKIKDIPPKAIAQIVWLFARVGRLFDIACTMVPLMERHIPNFSPIDFARLAQALPPESSIPLRICQQLQPRISSFNVNEFCFFFSACVRLCLLPDASGSIPRLHQQHHHVSEDLSESSAALVLAIDGKMLLETICLYMQQHESTFKREDIRRIVLVIDGYKEEYAYLLEKIPSEWKDIGLSLDNIKDKSDQKSSTLS